MSLTTIGHMLTWFDGAETYNFGPSVYVGEPCANEAGLLNCNDATI